jgi:hypothetical protein
LKESSLACIDKAVCRVPPVVEEHEDTFGPSLGLAIVLILDMQGVAILRPFLVVMAVATA